MKHFIAAIAVCLSALQAQAAPISGIFSSFFVLGDSLSDNGNLPEPNWLAATGGAPFVGGTFTNGEVWNQPLLDQFTAAGKASGNFAFGGARADGATAVPDFDQQIALLQLNTNALIRGPRPLTSVWFGANDIFDAFEAGTSPFAAAATAADALLDGMRSLAGLGIQDIIAFNLPDLGQTPAFALFQPVFAPVATAASDLFNAQLDAHIATLRGEGLRISKVDSAALLAAFRANPGAFGLSETALPCVFPNALVASFFGQPERCDSATAEVRLFVDGVHPNARAHAALTNLVTAQLAPIPLPAALPLLITALLALGFGAVARRKA